MNKIVARNRNLPAFSIELGELEVLWNRIIEVFGPDKPDGASINISLRSEELEFHTLDELRNYTELKGPVTKFSLHFSQGRPQGRRILNVFPGSLGNSVPHVYAESESEAWSAGAVEVVYSFLQSHRLWYHWFVSRPMITIIFVLIIVTSGAVQLLPKSLVFPKWILLAWLSTLITLIVFNLASGILLPSSILRITNEEGFIRRHMAELGLALALLSAVLTVVGWFFGK